MQQVSSRVSYQLINITGSTSNKQACNYEHRTRSWRPERPYRSRVNREKPTGSCWQTVQTMPIMCTQVSICRCLSSRFRIASNTTEKSLDKNRRVNFAPAFRWFTSRCSRVTTIISPSARWYNGSADYAACSGMAWLLTEIQEVYELLIKRLSVTIFARCWFKTSNRGLNAIDLAICNSQMYIHQLAEWEKIFLFKWFSAA